MLCLQSLRKTSEYNRFVKRCEPFNYHEYTVVHIQRLCRLMCFYGYRQNPLWILILPLRVIPVLLPPFLVDSQTVEETNGRECRKTTGSDCTKGLFVVCNHGST